MDHPPPASTRRRTRLALVVAISVTLTVVGLGPAAATPAAAAAVGGVAETSPLLVDPLPDPSEQAGLVSEPVGPDVPAWSYALVAVLAALVLALVGRSRPPRRVSRRGRREG